MTYNVRADNRVWAFHEQVATIKRACHEITTGQPWDSDEYRTFDPLASRLDTALREWQASLFDQYWEHLVALFGLRNVAIDESKRKSLRQDFCLTDHIDFRATERYLADLGNDADELALEAIKKEARYTVPRARWDNGRVYRRDPEALRRKNVVSLRNINRSHYDWQKHRLSPYAADTLAAVAKLVQVAVGGVKPREATSGWLMQSYHPWQIDREASIEGKIKIGLLVDWTRSYKNGRFDIAFQSEGDAKAFVAALREETDE
jgi:hypothetical protein